MCCMAVSKAVSCRFGPACGASQRRSHNHACPVLILSSPPAQAPAQSIPFVGLPLYPARVHVTSFLEDWSGRRSGRTRLRSVCACYSSGTESAVPELSARGGAAGDASGDHVHAGDGIMGGGDADTCADGADHLVQRGLHQPGGPQGVRERGGGELGVLDGGG